MLVNGIMRTHLLLFILIGYSSLYYSLVRCENEIGIETESDDLSSKQHVCSPLSNGTEPIVIANKASGALTVDLAHNLTKVLNCTWIIEIKKDNTVPLFFRVNGLVLNNDDNFTISKNGIIFDKSKAETFENMILFTGVTKGNVIVELNVSTSIDIRVFDVAFSYVTNSSTLPITLANRNGLFTLPVYNPNYKGDVEVIRDFKLDLVLQPPLENDFKLVVGLEEMSIEGDVDISGDESKVGKYKPENPDLISKKMIVITLKKFNLTVPKGNRMILYYALYSKECTKFEDEEPEVQTPEKAPEPALECLWIIENKDDVNYLLDYTDVHFFNDMDFFTVRSGNRRNSSVVAVINKQNKGHVQNSFRDTISMGKNLYITYSSPLAMRLGYTRSTIKITPMNSGGYFVQPEEIKLKSKPSVKPVIYVYKSDSKGATLESSKQNLGKGLLKLFDTDEIAGNAPFAVFTEGDAVPELIVSPSETLRLEFYNVSQFVGSLNKTDSELNLVAALNTASFMVTGATLGCSQTASWLIPKNPQQKSNETIFNVQTPYLSLNTAEDTLTLTKYSNKVTPVFTLKGAKGFNEQFLPDFLFFANSTYLFKYTRSKDCDPKDKSVLLQLSYNLNHITDYETTISLENGGKGTIAPVSYPNKYPLREQELNTFCLQQNRGCGWFVTHPINGTVLTTVLDIDLASGDSLDLPNKKLTTNELPPDELFQSVFVKMSAPINSSMVISEKLSGRGFKLNVTEFECGDTFEYPKTKSLKESVKNRTCAWIIKVESKQKGLNGNYLKFKIDNKGGNLTIIDSPSLRDRERTIKMNKSLEYQPASVNQTIIIYEAGDKTADLNIVWEIEQCKEWCKNGYRCILDSWRCDNESQCGDWSDEMNCNIPPNCPDAPAPKSGGVSGWVIAFVIFPLAMIVGAIVAKFGPTVLRRFRGSTYQEFRDFSEVS